VSAPVRLTFVARDAAHAERICAAVRAADAPDEIMVRTNSDGAPAGHTYRSLCAAVRKGVLRARRTAQGLIFTRAELVAYEERLAEARAGEVSPRPKVDGGAEVHDFEEAQIKAIERGTGLRRRR